MKTKTILLLSLLLCCSETLTSQMLYAEIGRALTRLDYKNSENEKIENIYPGTNFIYAAGYRHTLSRKFYLTASLSFNHFSSSASNPTYNNSYSWDARYMGIGAGLEFEFYRFKKFSFLAKVGAEPHFFMYGNQTINGQIYDLKGAEQFDQPFLFFRGGLGLNYCADDLLAITVKYMYGVGMPIGGKADTESMNLISSSLSFGIILSFRTCDYCFTKHFD